MPIFESPSYHGYGTTDYERIDPDYGTAEVPGGDELPASFNFSLAEAIEAGLRQGDAGSLLSHHRRLIRARRALLRRPQLPDRFNHLDIDHDVGCLFRCLFR